MRRMAAVAAIGAVVALAGCASTTKSSSSSATTATAAPATTPATAAPTKAPPTTAAPTYVRKVVGKLTTLGAGNYTVGTAIPRGIYNVTAPGQSGNFIVSGSTSYDEILGPTSDDGVPSVRVFLVAGDTIQLSGLSDVTFTPVDTPFVTSYHTIVLGTGTWIAGEDIAPGHYVATPAAGESGNFIVASEGVDEILGGTAADGGVPNVSLTLHKNDEIDISGLASVTMTAQT